METKFQVSHAARVLDKVRPGWAKKIDLSRLNMASIDDCILGQLFFNYATGWNKLKQLAAREDGVKLDAQCFIEVAARKSWTYQIRKRRRKHA